MNYRSLNSVVSEITEKKNRTANIKLRLHNAVNNLNRLDEITKLLDYKAVLPNKNWYPQVKTLYEILVYSLDIPISSVNSEKKSGRRKIFDNNRQDIVAKFRIAGIQKYRTNVLRRATDASDENEKKSDIWKKSLRDWRKDMNKWIDDQEDRLSSDEKKINTDRFKLLSDNDDSSEFTTKILEDLNNTDRFKTISYQKGDIDSIFKKVVVIDLFNE